MRTRFYIGIAMLALATLAPFAEAAAQKMPERRLVRKGNRQFGRERYDKSIESYARALEAAPPSIEAANAMFRAERYDTAEQTLKGIVADSTRSDIDRSEAVYNLGNTQFAQQKLKEALASYRAAMRLNPDDKEAKYNYAYTKHLLQQQEQQQQNDQNKDDQNQDRNEDNQQNQQNRQNGQDDKQQDGSQNDPQQGDGDRNPQQGDEGDRNEGEGQPQPKSGISEQEREAMLEAIQAQEDKTQDKLKEKTGVLVRGRKNW